MDKSLVPPSLLVACDDTATVEAALDLIDHCDDPLPDSIDPDQTQDFDMSLDNLSDFLHQVNIPVPTLKPNANSQLTQPTTTVVRRRTRKQEIAQLRAEERDLACTLENLRLQTYSQKHRGKLTRNDKVLPFWKKIASRQYQHRLDTERENRRLRSLLSIQVGRAKRLKLAWKKQMAAEGYHQNIDTNSQNSYELFPPDTSTVLHHLTREADAVYASLDAFLSGVQQPHQRNQVPFLNHADVYSLPFDSQVVDHAIWQALASRFRGHQQQSNVTDDTIRSCALRSCRMINMNLCLRVRWVARKYKQTGRTIVITRTFLEPLHHDIPVKVSFRETQVSIITPMKNQNEPGDDTNTPSTLVDTHASVTGNGPDDGTGDGMRAWIASSGGVAARDIWMQAFLLRKNGIEDQLFEVSRTMGNSDEWK